MRPSFFIRAWMPVWFVLAAADVGAAYKDDVGFTRLAAELEGAMPTGANVAVTQVESPESGRYMPNAADPQFAGKTFVNVTGTVSGSSGHATEVGRYFYGLAASMAPDVRHIDVYEAEDWVGDGFLAPLPYGPPRVETNRVQNHSWIHDDPGGVTNTIRRLDYAIQRDGFTAVVGLNNQHDGIPLLLAHSYNAISVGRSDGWHSVGTTVYDGAGRTKPEIVAPGSLTSWATPMVGAAAALLLEAAAADPALANAARPQCVKAILLAGATKDEFPSWDRTPARPLDEHFGAGELNVRNSYHVLSSGEQESSPTGAVACTGWDFGSLAGGTNRLYFLDVPAGQALTRLSVVLAWPREVANAAAPPLFDPVASLADLDLSVHAASNFAAGAVLDLSTSRVDNVEHCWLRHLPAGQYAIEVQAGAAAEYALAWFGQLARIPEITAAAESNGVFRIEALVTPDMPHAVEATTNLAAGGWTRVATNSSAAAVLIWTDSEASALPERYYRLIPDP